MNVKLKEKRPFMFRGVITWYDVGTQFEVLEEKRFPYSKDLFFKVKIHGCIIDGWNNANDFEKIN